MTGPRVAIVLLLLVAIVFIFAVSKGLRREDDKQSNDDRSVRNTVASVPNRLNRLLQRLRRWGEGTVPKIGPADLLDLRTGTIRVSFNVPRVTRISDSSEEYRQAIFRLTESAGTVSGLSVHYATMCLPKGVDEGSEAASRLRNQEQTLELPARRLDSDEICGDKDKACGKFTVFRCGGMFTFICPAGGVCEVALQN
jgi:hypothetical protein